VGRGEGGGKKRSLNRPIGKARKPAVALEKGGDFYWIKKKTNPTKKKVKN